EIHGYLLEKAVFQVRSSTAPPGMKIANGVPVAASPTTGTNGSTSRSKANQRGKQRIMCGSLFSFTGSLPESRDSMPRNYLADPGDDGAHQHQTRPDPPAEQNRGVE